MAPRPIALLAAAALAAGAQQALELHGSGTTNPAIFFWEVIDLFKDRTKIPVHMSYRGIGSGAGQTEFLGLGNPAGNNTPYNHFGSGDVPMSAPNFAALGAPMVHIPFAIGPIGIFHGVPAAATGGAPLQLRGCILARIFSRQITTWDAPEILAVNPNLQVPPGTNIVVVRRTDGSSSTAGTTQYFKARCGSVWTLGTGTTITWPADTVGQQGSDNVASYILSTPWSIGYVEAGRGHDVGLPEVELANYNNQNLTSAQADVAAAALHALQGSPSVIPADASADWSSVNLYDKPGDKTWPITMFSYFYIQKNLSAMDTGTAALLQAFILFSLSKEGQTRLATHGFTQVPQQILTYNNNTISNVVAWPAGMTSFVFETVDTTQVGTGALANVISGKRRSYGEYERSLYMLQIAQLQQQVKTLTAAAAAPPAPAAASGSSDASKDISIAAIVVACVAVLLSSASVCCTLRMTSTHCFGPLKEPREPTATSIGAPRV